MAQLVMDALVPSSIGVRVAGNTESVLMFWQLVVPLGIGSGFGRSLCQVLDQLPSRECCRTEITQMCPLTRIFVEFLLRRWFHAQLRRAVQRVKALLHQLLDFVEVTSCSTSDHRRDLTENGEMHRVRLGCATQAWTIHTGLAHILRQASGYLLLSLMQRATQDGELLMELQLCAMHL